MNLFRNFERGIDERLRKLFASTGGNQGQEIIEIQRRILDAIEQRVQQLPRARRVFPFNEVAVRIPTQHPERRAALELVFVSDNALREEICDSFRREGVEYPQDLRVDVSVIETAETTEPSIVCRKTEAPATRPQAAGFGAVRFTLEDGTPVQVKKGRVQIGRQPDVLDDRKRLVRRNDLTVEHDTVSRAHAHIEWSAGEFRLFDDGSSYGTSVIHEGRLADVPQAGGRGMRITSGDEIYFGQARVLFEVIAPSDEANANG